MRVRGKVSSTALMREMGRVDQLRKWLGEAEETQVILDTIEGETQALEMLDIIVDEWESDKGNAEKCRARATRIEQRADKTRYLAQAILERIGVNKLERAAYTMSVGAGVPSVIITDDKVIPRHLMAPDKTAIKSALSKGENVPGCTLNNVPPVLRIRTK